MKSDAALSFQPCRLIGFASACFGHSPLLPRKEPRRLCKDHRSCCCQPETPLRTIVFAFRMECARVLQHRPWPSVRTPGRRGEPDRICLEHFNPEGGPGPADLYGLARRSQRVCQGLRFFWGWRWRPGGADVAARRGVSETAIAHVARSTSLAPLPFRWPCSSESRAVEHRLTASGAKCWSRTPGRTVDKVGEIRQRLAGP